jgi:hypothetical protein
MFSSESSETPRWHIFLLMAAYSFVIVPACADGGRPSSPLGDPSPVGPAHSSSSGDDKKATGEQKKCYDYPLPFKPSYLPEGFKPQAKRGAGGYPGTNLDPHGFVAFYSATPTSHISFGRRTLPYPPTNAQRIRVMDNPAVFGRIEGGFSADFALRTCEYRMVAYGVTRREARRFATHLMPR